MESRENGKSILDWERAYEKAWGQARDAKNWIKRRVPAAWRSASYTNWGKATYRQIYR